ncbi:MAG: phage terminase large subunit [Bacteroidales bacterium]|nr:phage terminase large subunit [Bacteroidales bacterium]
MDITKTEAYKQWQRDHERIQRGTRIVSESRQVQHAQKERAKKDYAFFVKTYFPHIARTACGKFQLDAASYILKNPNTRAVFEWARGHAKSTHMGVLIPLWLKIQDNRQFNTMVLVGKSEDSADRLLADLQSELEFNDLYIHDYGQQMKAGSWAEGEFTTVDGCYFTAVGRGQSPRGIKKNGRRPDYIVIDDIDDDELVLNEKRVSKATEWVLSALFGTMEAGRGRFILVGNRIAKKSILTNIAARPGVYHTIVNILDKKGRPSWSENYTLDEIATMRSFTGERNFQKEYMNNPMTEGAVFKAKDIRYGKMLPLKEYRTLVCYTDPSFKNSATADYKATALVGKTPDGHFHVLKVFAEQTSVSEMIAWHYDIMDYVGGKVPVLYYMESNFMQDLMLDEFAKVGNAIGHHVPIRGDNRKKSDKFARIESMQPLFERGLVLFNEKEKESPGMKVLEEQLLLFERGGRAHDDAPDALESAVWMLSQRTRSSNARYAVIQRASRKF